ELERVRRVLEGRRGVAARVDLELHRVGEPVRDALLRLDRVGLVVVADVDEEGQVLAGAGDLGGRRLVAPHDIAPRGAAVEAGAEAVRADAAGSGLPLTADVQRVARVLARALLGVQRRGAARGRNRRLGQDAHRQVLEAALVGAVGRGDADADVRVLR